MNNAEAKWRLQAAQSAALQRYPRVEWTVGLAHSLSADIAEMWALEAQWAGLDHHAALWRHLAAEHACAAAMYANTPHADPQP